MPPAAPSAPTRCVIRVTHMLGRVIRATRADEVIIALRKSVPGLGARKVAMIMLEAHLTGRSTVIVCPREQAEYYAERLGSFGLTVTIEPAE